MNILVIGGLLALAVVAILGAVVLGLNEERAEKQQQEESALAATQVSNATTPLAPAAAPVPTQVASAPQMTDATIPLAPAVAPAPTQMTDATIPFATFPPVAPAAPMSGAFSPAAPIVPVTEAVPPATSGDFQSTRLLAPSLHENGLLSTYRSGQPFKPSKDERITVLNGQIREITGELRALVQRASALEQHLNNLNEALEGLRQDDTTAQHRAIRIDGPSF